MKIFFDPILTAEPDQCSTTWQFMQIAQHLLETRPDVFIYWAVPEWLTTEQLTQYPVHPRVRLVPVPQHIDRTKEYFTLTPQMDDAVAFNGSLWDWDVLVTVRSGMAQLYRLLSSSPRQTADHRLKKIWVIEEMPILPFKKSVAQFDRETESLFTLGGYLAADQVFITLCHEARGIRREAHGRLALGKIRDLDNRVREFVPLTRTTVDLKTADSFLGDRPFGLCYVGRMDKNSSRLEDINEIMVAAKIKHKDRVNPFVCTVSKVFKVFDESVVHMRNLKREQFWKAMREEAHLGIILHRDAGFTLSLIEPLTLGVPFVVAREEWSEAILGSEYPFYANSNAQVLAMVDDFIENYAQRYAQFADWLTDFQIKLDDWQKRYKLVDMFADELQQFDPVLEYDDRHPTKDSLVCQLVLDLYKHEQELVVPEAIDRLVRLGELGKVMANKVDPADRDIRGIVWSTPWNDLRMEIKTHGWTDASTITGHLKRLPTQSIAETP